MSDVVLKANRREPGRSNSRALRRQSIVPGIYYFHGEDSLPISVHELDLRPLINTAESHLVNLTFDDGTKKLCILKDISFHPITDRPVHFDLLGVAAGEMMKVNVPIALTGRAAGVADGGLVQQILNELEIECLPKNLPEHIEVDVTALNIGDSLHVSDITVENVTILSASDSTVVSISAPRVSEEEETADLGEEGAMEPELISKGKKDDEE